LPFKCNLQRYDVFRPPPHRQLLCCVVGSGVQIFQMALCSIGVAALGFLSPESHGGGAPHVAFI
jgi:hypothetical protein